MVHIQPNFILSGLIETDLCSIEADLEDVDLPVSKMLERAHRRVDSVYFPESGFASVVADGGAKGAIEVGIIGRDGMTGLSVLLGNDPPKNETYIQVAGKGQRIKASILRRALDKSPSLHRALLRYVHSFLDQAAMTALANGRGTIEERLARWLLLANDRIDEEELPLTQEFLSLMLGVTRPGVTVAVQSFERRRLIAKKRGSIVILNRAGLEKLAGATYTPAVYH